MLFLPFPFLVLQRGVAWPYSVHPGLEEGWAAYGIKVLTIPAVCELPGVAHGADPVGARHSGYTREPADTLHNTVLFRRSGS